MIKDYFILYNPTSGKGKSHKIINNLKIDLNKIGKKYDIEKTKYPNHAKNICQNIKGYKNIIIIGGDGTFNESINGLMCNKINIPNVGFLPGGTGNAFMHDIKAITYQKAIKLILDGNTKKIDVLKLQFPNNLEYAINIVGWGMASDINILAEKLRFLGPPRFTLASIYYALNKKSRKATLYINGEKHTNEYLFILNLNTVHTGKGMKAAPKALIDDGLIDVIIIKSSITKFQLLKLLPKIFTGEHIHSNKVEYLQTKVIKIIPQINEILNIDGEMKCQTPIEISIIPKKINIYC